MDMTLCPYLSKSWRTVKNKAVIKTAIRIWAKRLPESRTEDDYLAQLHKHEADFVEMLDRYQDPFLAGLTLKDAPRFSDWQYLQREHLAQLALRGYRARAHRPL